LQSSQFLAFAKVALQWLGARNMPESGLFKSGEAFEPVGVDRRAGSYIVLDEPVESDAPKIRDDLHPYASNHQGTEARNGDFLDCSHDSGHFGVIPELAEKASLRKTRICGDADIRSEPLGNREYRRSLRVDLACDLLGGFSRYLGLFCITGPRSNGSLYLFQDLRRVLYPMLFAQCQKLSCTGIPSLSHDQHALFAARAIGKHQVVCGREDPLASRTQKKREILHMIVAVMTEDVEAGQRIGLFGILNIPGQREGNAENHVVVEAGTAMIGMDQAAEAMHVDTVIAVPVEALRAEVSVSFRAEEMGFRRLYACILCHQAVGILDGSNVPRVLRT
jgi:hypothetical protein